MATVLIAGGGLAGLATAAALGEAGFSVSVLESRGFTGGRATSYPVSPSEEGSEIIDNCQHILLRCCVNLLDFYRRLGVDGCIRFHREFYFLEPGGRMSIMSRGILPAPLHFAGSFARMKCLNLTDKAAIARGIYAIRSGDGGRRDLDRVSMLEWLIEKGQTQGAIDRFWRQILVSAINEELSRMAAIHGFQVVKLGFLARSDSYEMGIPAVPLGELYAGSRWVGLGNVRILARHTVDRIVIDGNHVCAMAANGEDLKADYYVCALPFERVAGVAPELGIETDRFQHSPITGIHLWFDRKVTGLPHATLLDRTIQWMFNKSDGRYLQLVVSASHDLSRMPRKEIIDLAVGELRDFFPAARHAQLLKAHVVKEMRATFSAAPGTEERRPGTRTAVDNLFLAGDWTRSGWPATMEGAVRSGYIAAEAVARAAGAPRHFLLPDIA